MEMKLLNWNIGKNKRDQILAWGNFRAGFHEPLLYAAKYVCSRFFLLADGLRADAGGCSVGWRRSGNHEKSWTEYGLSFESAG